MFENTKIVSAFYVIKNYHVGIIEKDVTNKRTFVCNFDDIVVYCQGNLWSEFEGLIEEFINE